MVAGLPSKTTPTSELNEMLKLWSVSKATSLMMLTVINSLVDNLIVVSSESKSLPESVGEYIVLANRIAEI